MLQLKLATYPFNLFYCISLWRIVCVTIKSILLTEQGTGTRAVLAFLQCSAAIEDILFVGLKSSFMLFTPLDVFSTIEQQSLFIQDFLSCIMQVCVRFGKVMQEQASSQKVRQVQGKSSKVKQGLAMLCKQGWEFALSLFHSLLFRSRPFFLKERLEQNEQIALFTF